MKLFTPGPSQPPKQSQKQATMTRQMPMLIALAVFLSCPHSQVSAQVRDVEHVILIGVDGFSAEVLREHPERFPSIGKMIKEGASSLEMRSVLPSHSAANWKSILAGASPELHGFTTCCDSQPDLLPRTLNQYGMFPGIFGLIRGKYPDAETGCIYSWKGIKYLFENQAVNLNVCVDSTNIFTRIDSMTNSIANIYDIDVMATAGSYLRDKKPLFTFIYFTQPDVTGHLYGWQSAEYLNVVGGGGWLRRRNYASFA
jgi:hypothetical protein